MPAKSGGGGEPTLEETSPEGGTSQSWAMPSPNDVPTPATQSPQPHLGAGAVPGAVSTSQPILPVTSRGGDPCSQLQKRKVEPRRTDHVTEATQQGFGPRSQTFLGLWVVLQKYSDITVLVQEGFSSWTGVKVKTCSTYISSSPVPYEARRSIPSSRKADRGQRGEPPGHTAVSSWAGLHPGHCDPKSGLPRCSAPPASPRLLIMFCHRRGDTLSLYFPGRDPFSESRRVEMSSYFLSEEPFLRTEVPENPSGATTRQPGARAGP